MLIREDLKCKVPLTIRDTNVVIEYLGRQTRVHFGASLNVIEFLVNPEIRHREIERKLKKRQREASCIYGVRHRQNSIAL